MDTERNDGLFNYRITNWVSYRGRVARIITISADAARAMVTIDRQSRSADLNDLRPIVLSEDIIEQWGFVISYSADGYKIWTFRKEFNITCEQDGSNFQYYFEWGHEAVFIKKKISYVHEMQNMYADFYGKEFPISF